MSSNTPNLNLLKMDRVADGNKTFNIEKMLNENWDKIDEAVGNMDFEVTDEYNGTDKTLPPSADALRRGLETKQNMLRLADDYLAASVLVNAAPDGSGRAYPDGVSMFKVNSFAGGWPAANGYVLTFRAGSGGYQIFYEMYTGAEKTDKTARQWTRSKRDSNAFWQDWARGMTEVDMVAHANDHIRHPLYAPAPTGSGTLYTVATSPAENIATIPDGFGLVLVPNVSNTGAASVKIDGAAAIPLKPSPSKDFTAGDFETGVPIQFRKVGANFIKSSGGGVIDAFDATVNADLIWTHIAGKRTDTGGVNNYCDVVDGGDAIYALEENAPYNLVKIGKDTGQEIARVSMLGLDTTFTTKWRRVLSDGNHIYVFFVLVDTGTSGSGKKMKVIKYKKDLSIDAQTTDASSGFMAIGVAVNADACRAVVSLTDDKIVVAFRESQSPQVTLGVLSKTTVNFTLQSISRQMLSAEAEVYGIAGGDPNGDFYLATAPGSGGGFFNIHRYNASLTKMSTVQPLGTQSITIPLRPYKPHANSEWAVFPTPFFTIYTVKNTTHGSVNLPFVRPFRLNEKSMFARKILAYAPNGYQQYALIDASDVNNPFSNFYVRTLVNLNESLTAEAFKNDDAYYFSAGAFIYKTSLYKYRRG